MDSTGVHPLQELLTSLEDELIRLRERATELAASIAERESQVALLREYLDPVPAEDAIGPAGAPTSDSPVRAPAAAVTAEPVPLEQLGLTFRAYNCLVSAEITTLDALLTMSAAELLDLEHFGKKSLADVVACLGKLGLHLTDPDEPLQPRGTPLLSDEHTLGMDLDESAFAGWPEVSPFTDVRAFAGRRTTQAATEWRMSATQATQYFRALVALYGRAAAGDAVTVLDELGIAFALGNARDYELSIRYWGLDARPTSTLESIGAEVKCTRERVRQRTTRFRETMEALRPFLPLCQMVYGTLVQGDQTVLTVESWISAVPERFRPNAGMLRTLRQVSEWGWLPHLGWLDDPHLVLVAESAQTLDSVAPVIAQYRAAVRPYLGLGVLSVPEFLAQSGLSEEWASALLAADTRLQQVADGWWARRRGADRTVTVRRARRMVGLLGPLRTSDLCHGLQRALSAPRPNQIAIGRLHMKVIRDLLRAGGAQMVDGRVNFPSDPPVTPSSTDTALLDALTRGPRAVTIHEIDSVVREHGLSLAASRVAATASPLLRRVCYGVYALLGQSPAEEEIEAACERLEKVDADSILEAIVLPDGRVRVRYAPGVSSGRLPLPDAGIQPGWWKFTDVKGTQYHTEVRKGRVGRMSRMARIAARRRADWLELVFDGANRRIEWTIGPVPPVHLPRRSESAASPTDSISLLATA